MDFKQLNVMNFYLYQLDPQTVDTLLGLATDRYVLFLIIFPVAAWFVFWFANKIADGREKKQIERLDEYSFNIEENGVVTFSKKS